MQNNLRGPLSFIGTIDECANRARRLGEFGVDEIACLIDFGIGVDDTMAGLHRLAKLQALNSQSVPERKDPESKAITHV